MSSGAHYSRSNFTESKFGQYMGHTEAKPLFRFEGAIQARERLGIGMDGQRLAHELAISTTRP